LFYIVNKTHLEFWTSTGKRTARTSLHFSTISHTQKK